MAAQAYHLRGEALLASGYFESAEAELRRAEELASAIGNIRLRWDVNVTQMKLYQSLGRSEVVVVHTAVIQNIVSRIIANVHESSLRADLPVPEE